MRKGLQVPARHLPSAHLVTFSRLKGYLFHEASQQAEPRVTSPFPPCMVHLYLALNQNHPWAGLMSLWTVMGGWVSLSEPPKLSWGRPATQWGLQEQGLEESRLTGRTQESKASRTRCMDENLSR